MNKSVIGVVITVIFSLLGLIIYTNDKTSSNHHNMIYAKVIKVSDGDTITVLTDDKKQLKIRLKNIDSPEKKQAFGEESKKFTNQLIYGKRINFISSGQDKYGRELAEIYLNDINVNKEIVKNGYAWAYREFLDDKQYIQLEEQAKDKRIGLWIDKNPIKPSDWRKKNRLI